MHLVDDRPDLDRIEIHVDGSGRLGGGDLGLLDDPQHVGRPVEDLLDGLGVLVVEVGLVDHLAKAHDRGERRPQLVADPREELVGRAGGVHRRGVGADQVRAAFGQQLRRLAQLLRQMPHLILGRRNGEQGLRDPEPASVGVHLADPAHDRPNEEHHGNEAADDTDQKTGDLDGFDDGLQLVGVVVLPDDGILINFDIFKGFLNL